MISIVIPIFNEEENLDHLFERISNASESWKEDFEVILVDDGSNDSSPVLMRAIADKDEHFRIIKFSRNFILPVE